MPDLGRCPRLVWSRAFGALVPKSRACLFSEQDPEDVRPRHQEGYALLVALIALSLISLIGLFLSLAASSEIRVSDNFESHIRARSAGLAGLNHARALLKGLDHNDLLQGPDGSHDSGPATVALARSYGFRTPLGWPVARMLNIMNPAEAVAGMSDDGIINTGRHPGGHGVELIPLAGVAQAVSDPNGPGTIIVSRYFVKVSDNNGEAGELAQDPADDPFLDGDGQVIVRSMGVARSLREDMEVGFRRNSVALFEARFKQFSTFDLEAPLVLQGSHVEASSTEHVQRNSVSRAGGPCQSRHWDHRCPAGERRRVSPADHGPAFTGSANQHPGIQPRAIHPGYHASSRGIA